MSCALYVPIFVGELGWELINYVPYVNHIFSKKEYSEVHVVVRPGRECLYPMGTNFYTVDLPTNNSMANNGPKPPKTNIPQKLQKRIGKVDVVGAPPSGIRYVKDRKFLKYKASDEALYKWRNIPQNAVTMLVRGRKFGGHKNWSGDKWEALCQHLLSKGLTPVLTGIKHMVDVEAPKGCMDFQSSTTLEDLLAIMEKSLFVMGQSTGPAHFASLAKIPHAIWGTPRLLGRYRDSWNPHKTTVEYHSCKEFQITLDDAKGLADKMIKRLEL